jgi:hypothetical protein
VRLFNGLSFWFIYFAPTLIAWYRVRRGGAIIGSLLGIGFINLLIGWTVIGWFLMLANAFGINPVAWFVLRFGQHLPAARPAAVAGQSHAPSGSSSVMCGQCGGSGSITCSRCGGRGSWYNPPTGASGVAQLETCGTCSSSGRLRCPYCGGSGQVAGGIA